MFETYFNNPFDIVKLLVQGKPLLDQNTLKMAIYQHTKDMTFLEIYEENKWNLNITVTMGSMQSENQLLNYLTAPNVVVWSAVLASCAIPLVFEGVELM